MKIVNVLVTDKENGINSMDSFVVIDRDFTDEVIEDAEDFLIEKCVSLRFGDETNTTREDLSERNFYREDVRELIDKAKDVTIGNKTVSFMWSQPQNV